MVMTDAKKRSESTKELPTSQQMLLIQLRGDPPQLGRSAERHGQKLRPGVRHPSSFCSFCSTVTCIGGNAEDRERSATSITTRAKMAG
jgi:hypothetical protein